MGNLKTIWLVVCLSALVSCSSEKTTPQITRLNNTAVILAFGDSLTYGTGVESKQSYPAVLERLIKRKVINAGIPGETSDIGLDRLPDLLDEFKPSLLILIHGGNDYLRRANEQALQQNLTAMISHAQNANIDVIMLSVPKPSLLLKPAKVYAQLANQFNLPIEETVLTEVLKNKQHKSDNIHPNAKGYQIMAERIQALLVNAGAI